MTTALLGHVGCLSLCAFIGVGGVLDLSQLPTAPFPVAAIIAAAAAAAAAAASGNPPSRRGAHRPLPRAAAIRRPGRSVAAGRGRTIVGTTLKLVRMPIGEREFLQLC